MTATGWADLVVARAPALLRLAVMLTGDGPDAEDLLQRTLVRCQPHGDRIAGMAAPAAYLRQALVREHLNGLRLLSRRVRTTPLDVAPDAAAPAVDPEQRDEVWELLATLPRKQRAVLALRFYEDLPDGEIAVLLGCSEATVRSQAHRALAALRTRLETGTEEP